MISLAADLRKNQIKERQRGWLRQDLGQIAELMEKLEREEVQMDSDSELAAKRLRWLQGSFNDAWHHVQVMRVSERLVGIAALARSRINGIDGLMHSVYVEPEFRGYGFGRRLCQGIIFYAKSVGMESLEMPMTANEAARKLYVSLGFEPYLYEAEPHMFLSLLD